MMSMLLPWTCCLMNVVMPMLLLLLSKPYRGSVCGRTPMNVKNKMRCALVALSLR